MKWFFHALKHIFDYKGRARRAEFGWFNLIAWLLGGVLFFVPAILFGLGGGLLSDAYQSEAIADASSVGLIIFMAIYYMFNIAIFFVQLSLTTRRLHDLGFSGWWQLMIYLGLPIAVLTPAFLHLSEFFVGLIAIIILIVYLAYILMLLFKDGQRFDNKYGKDPKAPLEEPKIKVMPENMVTEPEVQTIEDKNSPKVSFSHIKKE